MAGLTDVTVQPRPTREALAEVSTNQIAAGVGVYTRVALTLVGVCIKKGQKIQNTDRERAKEREIYSQTDTERVTERLKEKEK